MTKTNDTKYKIKGRLIINGVVVFNKKSFAGLAKKEICRIIRKEIITKLKDKNWPNQESLLFIESEYEN